MSRPSARKPVIHKPKDSSAKKLTRKLATVDTQIATRERQIEGHRLIIDSLFAMRENIRDMMRGISAADIEEKLRVADAG